MGIFQSWYKIPSLCYYASAKKQCIWWNMLVFCTKNTTKYLLTPFMVPATHQLADKENEHLTSNKPAGGDQNRA